MEDLISRSALLAAYDKAHQGPTGGARKLIENAPDAITRCKDCKHYKDGFCHNPNTYDDEKTRGNTVPDWFCADGKPKD